MPKGPRGEKRPADVIGAAIKVARIATGEDADETPTPKSEGKEPAAASIGKRGGDARARKLTEKERRTIAEKAANHRWKKAKAALDEKEKP